MKFINFSNHPSSTWTEEQRNAALKIGEIVDINFPIIKPDESIENIERAARALTSDFTHAWTKTDMVVHVMGEMTFVHAVVNLLCEHGIRAVASTTERISIEKDGVKTSVFKFVQFRDYYTIKK